MAGTGLRETWAVNRVLMSGRLSRYGGGSSITDCFEAELAETFGSTHTLAVNSGTSALVCALVGAGVGPGDEVLVPAYTWVASATAPLSLGAIPVLVDIDESLTIDPTDIAHRITDRTKAIVPVHMNNMVCDMDPIMKLAVDHDLTVIEDACQAVGVSYHGRRCGTMGHVGAYSFNQHKNISSGEGGAVITDDATIATRAAMYHDVGSFIRSRELSDDVPLFVGVNLRMTEIAAAMLRPQLERIDQQMAKRRARRNVFFDAIEKSTTFEGRVAPHHDDDSAVSIAVQFDHAEQAISFSQNRGVERLIESGRHVFTNWDPIQGRRLYDDRFDPFADHPWEVDYSADAYQTTLDILERTCRIGVTPSVPLPAFKVLARKMFR